MRKFHRLLVLLLVTFACALVANGCGTPIVQDPNFHTWCGDQLCSWKLESGEIAKVPTWHKNDTGVELLDSHDASHVTAISQRSSTTPRCLEFSVIADVAAEAQVSISVDFGADGTVEYEQPIAALGFREQKTQVTAPLAYIGIKFTISKKGFGRAVLAQMDVQEKKDCVAAPVPLKPQALGTPCPLVRVGADSFGWDGAACISGICCDGHCAECCGNPPDAGGGDDVIPVDGCKDRSTCGKLSLRVPASTDPFADLSGIRGILPNQCDPGHKKRAAGAECLLPDDCTSGACEGVSWTLVNKRVDGGVCAQPPEVDPACEVYAVHGGVCR